MIKFKFNEKKTTQVVAQFLEKNDGRMNYMKLIKLLYLTDREALRLWERPLTGDEYFSMERGPVLSRVLDIINYEASCGEESYWYKYITSPENYAIGLRGVLPSEQDTLSKREIALIDEIDTAFKEFDQWDMVKLCHDTLPEWEDTKGTSKLISINDIFTTEGRTPDEIKKIEEEVDNLEHVKRVLAINE